ncbi:MAG TPA: glycosyltransferase, partial [Bryobacteraceae bacterium]|nr:glycosyltransferase [Bryobacteraceae bacterium]
MRVALVHYWLLGSRGGEKVLEAICRNFPGADIFTLFYDPALVSPAIRARVVHTSWLNPLRSVYRHTLPLMPMALEDLDLRGYDVIISSEAGPAKGVLTSATSHHFCYCHTPMRYLWELYPAYRHDFTSSALMKALLSPLAHYLRMWDYASAARVDGFMANSRNVRQRIWKVWRRRARVVYPPVPVESFRSEPAEDYSLIVAEMVPDKRLDYAIRCFASNGRKLRVVGQGPQYKALKSMAKSNIEFCGRVSDEELRNLYARASALIVPGEEDFGMTMVEALASGKPVIALGRGGAREIVRDGCGELFDQPDVAHLEAALQSFDRARNGFDPATLQSIATKYSEAAFDARFLASVAHYWMQEASSYAALADQVEETRRPLFEQA